MNELFHKYHIPLLKYIDHPVLITECKQNIDSSAYERYINKEIKLPSKKKEINRHDNITYWPKSIK